MTSFLDVIAADDSSHRLASRKAVVVAQQRVSSQFGDFIAKYGEEGLAYAHEEILGVCAAAADEFGVGDQTTTSNVYKSVVDYLEGLFKPAAEPKTASVHESRKTKMCPFHKDVVDISLAQGEPKAGFEAMSQHWGGASHCQGEGYKGDKCNFKPQMTTQSYWDERKEKAEQRKQEREQAAELEAQQELEVVEEPVDEAESVEDVVEAPGEDNVVEVDFGGDHAVAEPVEGDSEPLAIAASTKQADGNTGLKGPEPTIDKRKWTPQTVKQIDTEGDDSPNPTKRKDVVEPIKADNNSKLTEIGENTTERQDVAKDSNPSADGASTQTWTDGPKSAISSLIESDYDGFLPQAEVQKAVLAHRSR